MKITRHQAIRALVSALFIPVFAASQEQTEDGDTKTRTVQIHGHAGPLAAIVDTECTQRTHSKDPNSLPTWADYPECKGPTWIELDFDRIGGIAIKANGKVIRLSAAEIIESLESQP